MITAKVVLKDKFWILQREGVSVGTLRIEKDTVLVTLDDAPYRYDTLEEAKDAIGFGDTVAKTESSQLQSVMGYPTDLDEVFNVQEVDGLYCYTKVKSSKVVHAAGWFGMHRNGLHAEAFCPKVNTLKSYPYIGPYKNQTDLRVAMISWKRNDQTGYDTTRQVFG